MKTIILAAGESKRFYSQEYPTKVLYPINNIPLLVHNINTAKLLGSTEFHIVVNNTTKTHIINTLNEYEIDHSTTLQENPIGIANAISLFSHFTEDFLVILGDTYTKSSNLNDILEIHKKYSPVITTTAVKDDNVESVKRACTIEIGENNKINKIVEKPNFSTGIRGCGMYICSPDIFKVLNNHKTMEFTNVIGVCDSRYVLLDGICQNINTINDLNYINN